MISGSEEIILYPQIFFVESLLRLKQFLNEISTKTEFIREKFIVGIFYSIKQMNIYIG